MALHHREGEYKFFLFRLKNTGEFTGRGGEGWGGFFFEEVKEDDIYLKFGHLKNSGILH